MSTKLTAQLLSDPQKTVTRIVATIGPNTFGNLEKIVVQGTIRCNLAFVKTQEDIDARAADLKRIRQNAGNKICIMLDAVGPRVKLGKIPLEGIPLPTGEKRILSSDTTKETKDNVIVSQFPLHKYVKKGEKILLAEGKFICVVDDVKGLDVFVTVTQGGQLKKRGINLPDSDLSDVPALSDEDRATIAAMVSQCDVDQIALSFVRTADDVLVLRDFLKSLNKPHITIMSKIETQKAVDEIKSVAAVSDALMVARGDLWCELRDSWTLPVVTCEIIEAGRQYGIPVITATQVCSSMATNPLPSRAEVDELYFLLKEGTDCIMGSEEFGVGLYPAETAAAFRKVGELVYDRRMEQSFTQYQKRCSEPPLPGLAPKGSKESTGTDHFQRIAAIEWAEQSPRVKCIVVVSSHGKGARCVIRHHPTKPVVVITNHPPTARYMQQFQVGIVLVDYQDNSSDKEGHSYSDIVKAAMPQFPPFLRQDGRNPVSPLMPKGYQTGETALVLSHSRDGLFRVEEVWLPSAQ